MPYILQQEDPLRRLLRVYNITGRDLADILQVTEGTAYRRMKDCGTLTVAELHAIASRGHIPIEKIRQAI